MLVLIFKFIYCLAMAGLVEHLEFLIGSSGDADDDRRVLDEWARSVAAFPWDIISCYSLCDFESYRENNQRS